MAIPGFSVWDRKPEACVLVMVFPCMTLGRPLLFLGFSSAFIKEEGGHAHLSGLAQLLPGLLGDQSQLGRVVVVDPGPSFILPLRPIMVTEMVSIGSLAGLSSWCKRLCRLRMLLEDGEVLGCFDPCNAGGRLCGRSRVES